MRRVIRLLVASVLLAVLAHVALLPLVSSQDRATLFEALPADSGVVYARRIISPNIALANFAPTAELRDRGHHLIVSGHIECSEEARAHIHVTVRQPATGVEAQGQTQVVCTGALQAWTVQATIRGPRLFTPGPAEACGEATARGTGPDRATFTWCRAGGLTIIGSP